MKLVSFRQPPLYKQVRLGILAYERVVDVALVLGGPSDMLTLLQDELLSIAWLREAWAEVSKETIAERDTMLLSDVQLTAPLTNPTSLRDFYAFEQHVTTAYKNRGGTVPPEWYEIPVFYFSNHQAIVDPGAAIKRPAASNQLDFELEIAAIVGKQGRDISAADAEDYIAGYTIMNDWSARDLQAHETRVRLGPAKGKDFGTSLGPWLVTPDELSDCRSGNGYDLTMVARRNGDELSRGNWSSIHYSFGQMIERASAGVMLYPGDVVGSGTVGTGCILELTPAKAGGWLQPGDVVELEVERLGMLYNVVQA